MRRQFRFFSIIGMFFLLSACVADTPPPAPLVYEHAGNVWLTGAGNSLTHTPSGVVFPEKAGAYRRGKVTDFAEDGSDVGVGYWAVDTAENGFRSEITLYVTYGPQVGAGDYMDIASNAIVSRFEGAALTDQGTFKAEDGNPPPGAYRIYHIEINDVSYRSGVWVTKVGPWLMKARFTYPEVPDPLLETVRAGLEQAMRESGEQVAFTLSAHDAEDAPADMRPVADMLKAVSWGAEKP
ncbi:MAG: hypothetical protein EP335_05860 [Alphaproteobacteria bacterium]|nr:MAG: hypothetical protein EP335_05860 [Alphaproteobacteria bacterium]